MTVGPEIEIFMADWPKREAIVGETVYIEPLRRDHSDELAAFLAGPENADIWTYFGEGPFEDRERFERDIIEKTRSKDPVFYAIVLKETKKAVGCLSYLNINREFRSIEVGFVLFSPALKRSKAATEAQYLFAKNAFESLGYRRYQWRCNSLNVPSRNAALRLGFTFEGILRQDTIEKGRSRDTAFHSILDNEWPTVKSAFESWLHKTNFDQNGNQLNSLKQLRNQ